MCRILFFHCILCYPFASFYWMQSFHFILSFYISSFHSIALNLFIVFYCIVWNPINVFNIIQSFHIIPLYIIPAFMLCWHLSTGHNYINYSGNHSPVKISTCDSDSWCCLRQHHLSKTWQSDNYEVMAPVCSLSPKTLEWRKVLSADFAATQATLMVSFVCFESIECLVTNCACKYLTYVFLPQMRTVIKRMNLKCNHRRRTSWNWENG